MSQERLPRSMVVAYAVPQMGLAWFQMFFTNYFLKYSVDVLLIAPVTIALILSLTRLWDAVSDPAVGYLSDRTTSAAGRRRPWLLGSAVPVGIVTYAMWNPPLGLEGAMLVLWMAVAVTLWETAMTGFYVPYMALGAEVSMGHHDRTRVAGYRHMSGGLGNLSVIGCVYLITHSSEQRVTAQSLFLIGAAASATLMMLGIWKVREHPEHRRLGARRFSRSLLGSVRNPHLMRLVAIYFFDIAGVAAVGLLGPFVAEYVVGQPGLIYQLMLVYSFASYLSTPFTVFLSRRIGKRQVWMSVLALQIAGFSSAFFAGTGDAIYLLGCIFLIGLGSTGGQVVGMSLLADAADFDEHRTGERREGFYYASINIARKVMFSALTLLVGFAMQFLIGFEPNAEQAPDTLRGLSALFSGIPGVAFLVAIALLMRFGLTEAEHRRVRSDLDARKSAAE